MPACWPSTRSFVVAASIHLIKKIGGSTKSSVDLHLASELIIDGILPRARIYAFLLANPGPSKLVTPAIGPLLALADRRVF